MSILLLIPTRGRPQKAQASWEAAQLRAGSPWTDVMVVVDADDPDTYSVPAATVSSEGGGMGPPLNAAAKHMADRFDIVGFIGDDHMVRTDGWDLRIEEALATPGMAYGNDLARQDIPTQIFMSTSIYRALGWMALPGAKHLYLDDTWAELGRRTGCLRYLDDVIIEHMHPTLGKATTDAGYQRVNAPSMYAHDNAIYREWINQGQAYEDAKKVREVMRQG